MDDQAGAAPGKHVDGGTSNFAFSQCVNESGFNDDRTA